MNDSSEKILSCLRKHGQNDEKLSEFLVEIYNEELVGIHYWRKTYMKLLKKYAK